MKYFGMIVIVFGISSAHALSLNFRIVEETVQGGKNIQLSLPAKEKIIWQKSDWKCMAMSLRDDWGTFRCRNSKGTEVSSRFNCKVQKTFETSRSFRIAVQQDINVTFSFWCE